MPHKYHDTGDFSPLAKKWKGRPKAADRSTMMSPGKTKVSKHPLEGRSYPALVKKEMSVRKAPDGKMEY